VSFLIPQDWGRDAAGKDDEEDADALFFPDRGHGADRARALCRRCPVASECLQYALKDEDTFYAGVWVGTTPKERRKLQRVTEARRRPIKQERRAGTCPS
jgi:WhiB family redox-sensing transcriptional regulator